MTQSGWCWGWKLGLASCLAMGGALTGSGGCTSAQITPDGTLGAESSVVTPTNIDGLTTQQIDGGATRGANLFHSFKQFSIPTGGVAYFNNALNIQNIFSRVTGGSISNIDGLIAANGTANLFLLNPNGIIFGPNASVNIGGSFLGSTASSLNFADGQHFSATESQTTPLLTVSVPIGLQFEGNTRAIQVQQSILQVENSQTLRLVGGDVSLDGGILFAPGGQVELGGLAGAGTVGLNGDGNNLSLIPQEVQRADVSLTNGSVVDASGEGGGAIQVYGRRITLTGGSRIGANTLGAKSGGALAVNASESVELIGETADGRFGSGFFTSTRGTGAGGNLTITTGHLIPLLLL